jgi:hypothetical protein
MGWPPAQRSHTGLILAVVGAAVLIVVLIGAAVIVVAGKGGGYVTPNAGRFTGSDPEVSFNVDASGLIQNLTITGPMPGGSCTITMSKSVTVTNGSFDPGLSGVAISGHFTSPTTAEGTIAVSLCAGSDGYYTVVSSPEDTPWTATLTG